MPNFSSQTMIGFPDKSEEKLLDLGVLEIKFKGKRQLVAAVLCPRGADGLAVLGSKGSENTESVAYAGTLDVETSAPKSASKVAA